MKQSAPGREAVHSLQWVGMLLKLYTEPYPYFPAIPAGEKIFLILKADSSLISCLRRKPHFMGE